MGNSVTGVMVSVCAGLVGVRLALSECGELTENAMGFNGN